MVVLSSRLGYMVRPPSQQKHSCILSSWIVFCSFSLRKNYRCDNKNLMGWCVISKADGLAGGAVPSLSDEQKWCQLP